MENTFCPKCGSKQEGNAFCSKCGNKLKDDSTTSEEKNVIQSKPVKEEKTNIQQDEFNSLMGKGANKQQDAGNKKPKSKFGFKGCSLLIIWMIFLLVVWSAMNSGSVKFGAIPSFIFFAGGAYIGGKIIGAGGGGIFMFYVPLDMQKIFRKKIYQTRMTEISWDIDTSGVSKIFS